MTPAELAARLEELQKEEWHKQPGGLDGGQQKRALERLAAEIREEIAKELESSDEENAGRWAAAYVRGDRWASVVSFVRENRGG